MTMYSRIPIEASPLVERHSLRDHLLELLRQYGRQIGLPLVLALLISFFAATSDVFFTVENFRNVGVAAAALAAVAFGQTFTILTAGMDLSVGSTVALVSVVGALAMRNYGIAAGITAALATGVAVGLVNGLVITRFKVFPFIATLAMMSIASGLGLQLAGGVPVPGLPEAFGDLAYELVLGIPVPVLPALFVLVVAWLVLDYTRLGRRVYAIGGNEQAARLSGIDIDMVKLAAYSASGLCAAVGSLILTSRIASGQPSLGASLPLEIGSGGCARRRVAVRRPRLRPRGGTRRGVRQHPGERLKSAERVVLRPDDGYRCRPDPGSGAGPDADRPSQWRVIAEFSKSPN